MIHILKLNFTQKVFNNSLNLNELMLLQLENQMGFNWMKSSDKCLI